MSTILEALRKSEAERADALGETPMAPAPEPASRRWLAAALPVVLLAALAIGWFATRPPAEPAPAVAAGDRADPAEQVVAGAPPAPPGGVTAAPATFDAQARQPAPPPSKTDNRAGASSRGSLSTTLPTALDGPPVATAPLQQMDPGLLGSAEDLVPADSTPRIITRPVPEEQPPQEARPEPREQPAPVARAEVVPRDAPARSHRADTLSEAALLPSAYAMPPGAARTRLEALKLNMHVYAVDPGARFVLIDLRRRVEGDDLGDGLRIARIAPEGVVLEAGGSEWLWAPR